MSFNSGTSKSVLLSFFFFLITKTAIALARSKTMIKATTATIMNIREFLFPDWFSELVEVIVVVISVEVVEEVSELVVSLLWLVRLDVEVSVPTMST